LEVVLDFFYNYWCWFSSSYNSNYNSTTQTKKNRGVAFILNNSANRLETYQISNSLDAIHHGNFWGQGIGNGQYKLGFYQRFIQTLSSLEW